MLFNVLLTHYNCQQHDVNCPYSLYIHVFFSLMHSFPLGISHDEILSYMINAQLKILRLHLQPRQHTDCIHSNVAGQTPAETVHSASPFNRAVFIKLIHFSPVLLECGQLLLVPPQLMLQSLTIELESGMGDQDVFKGLTDSTPCRTTDVLGNIDQFLVYHE